MSSTIAEFLKSTVGQISTVVYAIAFLYAGFMSILLKPSHAKTGRVFGIIAMCLGLVLLAFSLAVVFAFLPESISA